MLENPVGRIPHRNPPQVLTRIHVDRRNPAIRGLEDGESLDGGLKALSDGEIADRPTRRLRYPGVPLMAGNDLPRRATLLRGHIDDARLRVRGGRAIDVRTTDVAGAPDRSTLSAIVVPV